MNMLPRFVTPGLVFVLTLVFGVWLSLSGRPYNGILFNIHKLVALATAIVTAVAMYNTLKSTQISALLAALVAVAGLGVAVLFFSGAMMSAGKLRYGLMLAVHRIGPIVAALSLAMTILLLQGRKP